MTTTSLYTFANWVYDLMVTNKDTLGFNLVTYGDQQQLPYTPAVCIETERKVNELTGAFRKIEVDMVVSLIIYHSKVDSSEENKRAADQLGEAVETLLHQNPSCGGLTIHSMVTLVEAGYADKRGTLYRTTRVEFHGQSKSQLPANV